MWESIFSNALEVGLMAALFVGLLVYVLRDTGKREKKYQEMIAQLQDCLVVVNEIRDDVTDIKTKIDKSDKGEKKK